MTGGVVSITKSWKAIFFVAVAVSAMVVKAVVPKNLNAFASAVPADTATIVGLLDTLHFPETADFVARKPLTTALTELSAGNLITSPVKEVVQRAFQQAVQETSDPIRNFFSLVNRNMQVRRLDEEEGYDGELNFVGNQKSFEDNSLHEGEMLAPTVSSITTGGAVAHIPLEGEEVNMDVAPTGDEEVAKAAGGDGGSDNNAEQIKTVEKIEVVSARLTNLREKLHCLMGKAENKGKCNKLRGSNDDSKNGDEEEKKEEKEEKEETKEKGDKQKDKGMIMKNQLEQDEEEDDVDEELQNDYSYAPLLAEEHKSEAGEVGLNDNEDLRGIIPNGEKTVKVKKSAVAVVQDNTKFSHTHDLTLIDSIVERFDKYIQNILGSRDKSD